MAIKKLKKMSPGQVNIFKIRNRRGYAAISLNHLTEGRTPVEAFNRMVKAVKRAGYALAGKVPKAAG